MKNATFIPAILVAAAAVTGASALAAGPKDRDPVSFQELDANSDGQISKEEMTAHRDKRFTDADANGDGQLSVEEMRAAAQKHANDRVATMFEKHDANKDGVLSSDELPKPRRAEKMFDRMDADDNGSISEQEYADAKHKFGRHHKRHGKSGADDS